MSENLKFFLMFGDIYQFFGKKSDILCQSKVFRSNFSSKFERIGSLSIRNAHVGIYPSNFDVR